MISHPRTHKGAMLIAAYVMFACVAALLSVNLTSPTSAALGADWQCSRFALVITTCTPVRAHETVSTGVRKAELTKKHPERVLVTLRNALSDAELEEAEEDWSECMNYIKTARAALSK